MRPFWADLTRKLPLPAAELLALIACIVLGFVLARRFRRRIPPAELEKRRRQMINRQGKLGDGEIVDIDGDTVFYSYSVAGVGYTTSQDVGALVAMIPADRAALLGPVAIKFLTANPPNSIVLCEDWSGLRPARSRTLS